MPLARTGIVFTITASLALAAFSVWMLAFQPRTPQPSLLNCFGYLGDFEATLLYFSAIALAFASAILAVLHRRAVIPLVEASVVLAVAYAGLTYLRLGQGGALTSGVFSTLLLLFLLPVGLLAIARGDLIRMRKQGLLK